MEEQAVNRTTELGRKLFYAAYFLMLVRTLLTSSMLCVYIDIDGIFIKYVLRIAFWLPIIIKFITQDTFSERTLLRYALFICVFTAALYFSRRYILIDIAILVVGVHGVPLKSAVRLFFYTASVICGMLFFMSLAGIIENYVNYTGDRPRYAFGSTYATDFAATLFYIELAHAYLKGKKYNVLNFLFWIAVSFFVFYFCVARLDFVLIFCTAWAMLGVAYIPKLFSSHFVQTVLWIAIPAFFLLSFILHIAYTPNSAFLSWLNNQLSGRLYYGNLAIKDYGFSLFGQYIKMQGWGFTMEEWDPKLGYYFVDCGWLSIALQYGVIIAVFTCAVFTVVSRRSLNAGDCVLPVILFFLALTSIVDHHMFQYHYDPFLLVLNAGLCVEKYGAKMMKRKTVSRNGLISHGE